jgi:Protein of unknown function (DUF1566)
MRNVRLAACGLILAGMIGDLVPGALAQRCGDPDDSGTVTLTDGVQVLRAATGLDGGCTGNVSVCDVDGSGAVTVTDGVNVLRAAASLPVNLSCASTGRFIDNSDGTVTDTQTGLQWEKKTSVVGSGASREDPHDVDNTYHWCLDLDGDGACEEFGDPSSNGTFADFLASLNTSPCFANKCDWRLPNVGRDGAPRELETIVDPDASGCGSGAPCVDPIFGPTAVDSFYWSATTHASDPLLGWSVSFFDGQIDFVLKLDGASVRAVRDAHD